MASVEGSIPSMIQGMSQQAPELRLPTQGDLQINGQSDPVYGLGQRGGTSHVKKLAGIRSDNGIWSSWISRDDNEKYALIFDGYSIRVFGLDGYEYPVTADSSALAYLQSSDPKADIRTLTLADTTVILNRKKTVAMSDTNATSAITDKAVVWIKQGNYGQNYKVTFGGNTYTETTSTTDVTELATSKIASDLVATIGSPSGYTITYTSGDSYFTVHKTDNTDFDIEVKDSIGGAGIAVVKNRADSFDQLPPVAPDGYICLVSGSADSAADDYWVEFDATTKPGSWVECVAPDTQTEFDAATMPLKLDRLQDDEYGTNSGVPLGIYFHLDQIDWDSRVCGDTTNVPNPSIVGGKITAVFLAQNRLCLLMRDTLVTSRTGDYFNLWRQTATRILDDDPIDVTIAVGRLADDRVLDLRSALNFAEEILLVGNRAQVIIPTTEALTPSSIRAALATSFEASATCDPVMFGSNALLPYSDGTLVGLREFRAVIGSDRLKDSDLLSEAIPRLMGGRPIKVAVCSATAQVFIQTSSTPRRLFVYKTTFKSGQRIQAAWGYWDFAGDILSFDVLESTLWLVIDRPEGPCLERVELPPLSRLEGDTDWPLVLDRKTPCGTAYVRDNVSTRTHSGASGLSTSPGSPPGGGGPGDSGPPYGTGDVGDPDAMPVPPIVDGELQVDPGSSGSSLRSGSISSARDRGVISYDEDTNKSEIELPWELTEDTVFVRADTLQIIPWTLGDDPKIAVFRGNITALAIYAGIPFEFRFRFGPATIWKQTPLGSLQAVRSGRLQISRYEIVASTSGPFQVLVYKDGDLASTKTITPRIVGGKHSTALRDVIARSLVLSRADKARVDLVSTGYWPCWFISAQWFGEYTSP